MTIGSHRVISPEGSPRLGGHRHNFLRPKADALPLFDPAKTYAIAPGDGQPVEDVLRRLGCYSPDPVLLAQPFDCFVKQILRRRYGGVVVFLSGTG